MFKNQRQNEILEMLSKEKFISVQTLADRLYASLPTVRRDLTALENAGLVKRSHGGVMLYDGSQASPVFFRQGKRMAEKAGIARLASGLVSDGSVIFADSSSTALHIADYLPKGGRITVITNGLLAARRFAEEGAQVFSTGGRLLSDSYAFVGHSAEEALSEYNADLMFFSAASLSDDGIISDWSEDERNMRRAMASFAGAKVFMCDSSKFGTTSAFKLFSIDDVDYVITDTLLPDGLSLGLELVCGEDESAYMYKRKQRQN